MNADKLVAVGNDDWWGLYVNGKLVHEGHDGPQRPFFEAVMRVAGVKLEVKYADYEWLEARGNLPEDIKKVKFGKSR